MAVFSRVLGGCCDGAHSGKMRGELFTALWGPSRLRSGFVGVGRVIVWVAMFAIASHASVVASRSAWGNEPAPASQSGGAVAERLTFEQHVRPLLKVYCLDCHGAGDELQGKLDLRLARLVKQGGENGPAIVPGKPADSLLIQRIVAGEMPPGEKKMPAADVARLRQWIAEGAVTARPEPEKLDQGIGITPEEREFWAFQPLRRPAVPEASSTSSAAAGSSTNASFVSVPARTPIDRFVANAAAERGLAMAPAADASTLLRRATLDLIGLPPTREELEEFAQDSSPDAYERRLDRLLASPKHGERWARHWLDVAGYADSDGYTSADAPRAYAYKFRDYVIRAMNADLPVDRFVLEQLAGDELVGATAANFSPEQIQWLEASGFLRMAADGTGSGAPDQDLARNQVVADTVRIVSTSLLGLSVHCAQCHNHRYDPIPQSDYYRLRAIFEPALDWKSWRPPQARLVSLYTDADRAAAAAADAEAQRIAVEKDAKQKTYLAAALEKELLKFPEAQRPVLREAYQTPADKRSAEQAKLLKENPSVNISPGVLYQYDAAAAEDLKKFDQRIAEARGKKPVEDFVHALVEPRRTAEQKPPATFVFHRGDHRQPKATVGPGDLSIAAPPGERFEIPEQFASSGGVSSGAASSSGRRAAFARHVTSGGHPLFGRVQANRLWLHHFGRGLVGTPADFGMLGQRPTHPELLDWLATEWPARDWSWKRMHRLLMTSHAYRQSSSNELAMALDQDNRWLTRFAVRRLEAESIRDRMLAASGLLSGRMFGPSAAVKEDEVGQVIVAPEGESRRSVYLQQRRSQPVALLAAFDAPVMETNCEQRSSSTVATQSLMLLNGDFALKQAAELARVAQSEADLAALPTLETETLAVAAKVDGLRRPVAWQAGYGAFDEAAGRVVAFQVLPHWTGGSWQGGPVLPDARIGWVLVNAGGGHPGHGREFAAIRRWTAPRAGVVSVAGKLSHPQAAGDGVRGRLVSSRTGKAGEWVAFNQAVDTKAEGLAVEAGDTLDFVVDCRESENADSFGWSVTLSLSSLGGGPSQQYVSEKELPAPRPAAAVKTLARAFERAYGRSASDRELRLALELVAAQAPSLHAATGESIAAELAAITNVCQALITSNEFLYVD